MQLPIDVVALSNEITDIDAALETPISVSVYIDDSASVDVVAHVRNMFASSMPTVRMTVTYLDSSFFPHPADDMAIVVAGSSLVIGSCVSALHAVGVPVMVVTASPQVVARTAAEEGYEIAAEDIVSSLLEEGEEEPLQLDEEAANLINERMGRWIVEVCREKRLALSIAFPFMRRELARDSVRLTSLQNAGVGLVPLLTVADMPIMTLNQAKMVMQIAAAYGHTMNKDRVKELAAVLGGAYLSRTVARELVGLIPFLGWAIRAGVAYGSTSAMGYGLIEYYEGGGDAVGVANVLTKASETGTKAVSWVAAAAADPSILKNKVSEVTDVVRDQVDVFLPKAKNLVGEYGPQAADKAGEYVAKVADVTSDRAPKVAELATTLAPKVANAISSAASKASA